MRPRHRQIWRAANFRPPERCRTLRNVWHGRARCCALETHMMARIFLIAVVVVCSATASQNLTGSVRDTTGAALASASVTLMDEDTGVRRTVQTAPDGTYGI